MHNLKKKKMLPDKYPPNRCQLSMWFHKLALKDESNPTVKVKFVLPKRKAIKWLIVILVISHQDPSNNSQYATLSIRGAVKTMNVPKGGDQHPK